MTVDSVHIQDQVSDEIFADMCAFHRERRHAIMDRIQEVCHRHGRSLDEIVCLAISKTTTARGLHAAYEAGWRVFGESRPQELASKCAYVAEHPELSDVVFHMIGNLQTNKINPVLERVAMIHSVASLHLAQAISKRAELRTVRMPVLLEVNVSGELSKSGFAPDEVQASMDELMTLPGIEPVGCMTMAPAHDPKRAQQTFADVYRLREKLRVQTGLPLPHLSCGMSDDFEYALAEGADLLRLGRIVFDPTYRL